jgi:hypothetical protein
MTRSTIFENLAQSEEVSMPHLAGQRSLHSGADLSLIGSERLFWRAADK